jgi:hypothetical protein
MASESRKRLAKADRSLKAAELHLQGLPHRAIAKRLGVGVATVHRDLKAVHARWQDIAVQSRDAWVSKELARLTLVERAAWKAWRASQKDREVITVKKTDEGTERTVRREGQAGDPAFLRRVLDCIARRCELLGLNAPTRQEHTGPNGGPIPLAAVQLTDEQLYAIAQGGSQGVIEAAPREDESTAVYPLHESTLPGELAP